MCSVPQWICIYVPRHSDRRTVFTATIIIIRLKGSSTYSQYRISYSSHYGKLQFFCGKLWFSVRLKVPWAGRGTANIICCKSPNRVHESESDLSASHYSAIMYLTHKLSLSHYSHFCSFVDLFFRNQKSGAWGQEWSRVGVMQRDSKKCRL